MAIRTTPALVKGIILAEDTLGLGSADDLTPFIQAASILVDAHCTNSDYDDDKLQAIETWLAAHSYCALNNRKKREWARGVGEENQHKIGLMLQNTYYGQMALMLDTAGNLAKASKDAEMGHKPYGVVVSWLGTCLNESRCG